MGCGRVGSSVADGLSRIGHDVAVIDSDVTAFSRLSAEFAGERVLGLGFDRDVLLKAGIEGADAFAAVSSGDNSNIISARLARETFGVRRVVARIYDAKRADGLRAARHSDHRHRAVDHRPTAARAHPGERDRASGATRAGPSPSSRWCCTRTGSAGRATELEAATGARVAFLIRFGTGILPEPKTVIQSGDQVYIAAISGHAAEALAIAALPPSEDAES